MIEVRNWYLASTKGWSRSSGPRRESWPAV